MNLNEELKSILNMNNKKIKELSLEEYLNELKKNNLFELLSLYINSSKDVIGMYVLKEKSKRQLIKYINENLKDILTVLVKFMKPDCLNFLKEIIPNLKEKEYEINEDIPFNFVMYFKKFYLASFEYNENNLKCFMPKQFVDTFEIILKDKNILKENEKNNLIYKDIINILSAYGIIELDSLNKFINYKESLESLLNLFSLSDDYIHIYEFENQKLICNIEFQTEDMAIDYYKKQTGIYKKFSTDDLELIGNGTYASKSKSYTEFINYLKEIFDLTEEDTNYILDFLIDNYIYTANISKEEANEEFKINAKNMFDLSDEEIEDMRKIAEKIFDDYPKWIKRGNI